MGSVPRGKRCQRGVDDHCNRGLQPNVAAMKLVSQFHLAATTATLVVIDSR